MNKPIIKINTILYDNIYRKYLYVVNEIISDDEVVEIPEKYIVGTYNRECFEVTHIGFVLEPDKRTEQERWEDEYRFYIPQTNSIMGVEVKISENVKKIIIPASITCISKEAFANKKNLEFEIHPDNQNFKFVAGCLFDKNDNIIYKIK